MKITENANPIRKNQDEEPIPENIRQLVSLLSAVFSRISEKRLDNSISGSAGGGPGRERVLRPALSEADAAGPAHRGGHLRRESAVVAFADETRHQLAFLLAGAAETVRHGVKARLRQSRVKAPPCRSFFVSGFRIL